MKDHELKTIQPFFGRLGQDGKNFEVRYNDRGIEKGDILVLSEWGGPSAEWVGNSVLAKVTYRLPLIVVPNLVLATSLGNVIDNRHWEVFGLKFLEDGKVLKRIEAHKIAHKLVS